MENLYHPAADPELHAPDFVEAVGRFRSAVKEFTAAVDKLDETVTAAMKVFAKEQPDELRADDIQPDGEIPIPEGYHPPA